jgi:hypothetical protein
MNDLDPRHLFAPGDSPVDPLVFLGVETFRELFEKACSWCRRRSFVVSRMGRAAVARYGSVNVGRG